VKITRHKIRRIIKETLDQQSYDLGREDAFAGIEPQLPNQDYMMGYNEVSDDDSSQAQPPSDGSGKPLDPNILKGAYVSSREDRNQMANYISNLKREVTKRQLRQIVREATQKDLYGELQNDILSIGQKQGGELVVADVINMSITNASMSYDEVLEIMQDMVEAGMLTDGYEDFFSVHPDYMENEEVEEDTPTSRSAVEKYTARTDGLPRERR